MNQISMERKKEIHAILEKLKNELAYCACGDYETDDDSEIEEIISISAKIKAYHEELVELQSQPQGIQALWDYY